MGDVDLGRVDQNRAVVVLVFKADPNEAYM